MTIDWQKEVEARKDDLLKDLGDLIRINSIRDVEHGTKEEPLGPGPAAALRKVLEIGDRDGFVTKNIENVAGHIEYGDGEEMFGLLGHVDVVPVDDNWDTDPFEPVIKDGKLYARGSADDKGPSIAAYYAMRIIKDLELPISKKFALSSVPTKKVNGLEFIVTWKWKKCQKLVFLQMHNSQSSTVKKESYLMK